MLPYLPFLLFCFASTLTPGPNNILLMSSGMNFGIRRSLPFYFGVCLGFSLLVLVIGLGLGAVFLHFPVLHLVIKIAGVLYLLYLAFKIATSHKAIQRQEKKSPLRFFQGALLQWLNIKVWIVAITAVSTYTKNNGHLFEQAALISTFFLLVALFSAGCWLFSGAALTRFLTSAKHRVYFNYLLAALLLLSIFLLFVPE